MAKRPGSVRSAMFWMFALSILLFWLPIFGPMIAGFVGGRKAGTLGDAILAVILPGIVFGVVLFLLASFLTGLPVVGFLAGAGGGGTRFRSHRTVADRRNRWRYSLGARHPGSLAITSSSYTRGPRVPRA